MSRRPAKSGIFFRSLCTTLSLIRQKCNRGNPPSGRSTTPLCLGVPSLVVLFVLLSMLVGSSQAQNDPNTQQGLTSFASFQGGNIDHINLGNGNLYVNIPIASFPQRGSLPDLSFSLVSKHKGFFRNLEL